MARDSILDEVNSTEPDEDQLDDLPEVDDHGRVKLTQRMPVELVLMVDQVQEEYALPSRTATINFIVKQGIKELNQ